MTNPQTPDPTPEPTSEVTDAAPAVSGGLWHGQPTWAKVLIICSLLLMVAGVAMPAYLGNRDPGPGSGETPAAVTDSGTTSDVDPALLAPGFVPGGGPEFPAPTDREARAAVSDDPDVWSPTVFRLGFSFFVGFAIGYAVRSFVKLSVLTAGFMLLFLFGLQYAGIVEVRWAVMEGHYDSVVAWLQGQTASFRDFFTGYLPSTATAVLGLTLGFRKR